MGRSASKACYLDCVLTQLKLVRHSLNVQQQQVYLTSLKIFSAAFMISLFLLPTISCLIGYFKRYEDSNSQVAECPRCKIYLTDVVVLPCRHFSHCMDCYYKGATYLQVCSVCQRPGIGIVRIYL